MKPESCWAAQLQRMHGPMNGQLHLQRALYGTCEELACAVRAEVCRDLDAAVRAFGLYGCWAWKPLLDGKQVLPWRSSLLPLADKLVIHVSFLMGMYEGSGADLHLCPGLALARLDGRGVRGASRSPSTYLSAAVFAT